MIAKQPRPDELPETTPPYRRRAARDFSKKVTINVTTMGDARARVQPFGFSRALCDGKQPAQPDGWQAHAEALAGNPL